jgi:hypothetical protein
MDAHAEQRTGARGAAALLHQAAQHIEAARLLLERGYDRLPPEASEALATAARLGELLPGLLNSPHFLESGQQSQSSQSGPHWAPPGELVEQVNERFGLSGVACARVLLYLIEHRDRMVSISELAAAVGLRARSTGVIKVYVCRLRKAFVEHGFSSAAFETGPGSYSFRSALHPAISDLIERQ